MLIRSALGAFFGSKNFPSRTRNKRACKWLTGIVGPLDLLAPDGARHEEPVLQESVHEVGRLRVGATQQLDGDGGLLGPVASLKPVGQRLEMVDAVAESRHRRRRRWAHHHISGALR